MTRPFAAVIGWPVNHSLSPVMMRAWLTEAGLAGEYGRVELPDGRAESLFRALPELGWAGVNVTAPHKQAAFAAAQTSTDAARAVGAANLLTVSPSGDLMADNTDITGIAAALREDSGRSPAVLIGAGGAAGAALFHLARQDREVTIVNRTVSKADALASHYDRPIRTTANLDQALTGAGLVINATTLGMHGQPALEPDLTHTAPEALVFDMVYAPLKTPLLSAAQASGRRTVDGLTMLIGQAVPSFEAFFGHPPPNIDMKAILLTHLGDAP